MELGEVIKDLKVMRNAGFIDCNIQNTLDKLNKVTESIEVDQFIADWYETYKDNLEYSLWEWMRHEPNREKNKEFYLWLNDASNNPVETLVKMKLFGYKVKKVKRYIVKIKRVNSDKCYLNCVGNEDSWIISDKAEYKHVRVKHTKKELCQAGFGWVFNCPGIEVEEAEE